MSKTRIEIIAIGEDAIYSIGAIEISENDDVYFFHKASGSHISRHASGQVHTRLPDGGILKIRDGSPIHEFEGYESLGTFAFGLSSLPVLHKEYRMQSCNGIFAVDMRAYKGAAFNMAVALLTNEGMNTFQEIWKGFGKTQMYVYMDSHPMIGIKIGDAKDIRPKHL